MKSFTSIDGIDATELSTSIVLTAKEDGLKPISVAVVDAHGHPLEAYRMEGASADSFFIAIAKAETAVRGGRDTVEITYKVENDDWKPMPAHEHRADDNRRVVNPGFISWAGGCVIRVDGAVAGAVAVSGRDELDDHELASVARKNWRVARRDDPDAY